MTEPVATLCAQIAALEDGSADPPGLMRETLARIERWEGRINAFAHLRPSETLIAEAEEAGRRRSAGRPTGPLDGIPITVKDTLWAQGLPTRMGSRLHEHAAPAPEDAPAVARLREQGAIVLGKTTTSEFGWKALTDSPLTGITRNPLDLSLTPGGSSGGAAAALAAGIGALAIGTDAAGSLRVPAAFCGLVGFKGSRGRIAAYPPSGLWTLGHVGPLTRDVADAAYLYELLARPDIRDWSGLPAEAAEQAAPIEPGRLRLAYSPTLGYGRVDPEIADAVERAVAALERDGASVDRVERPFADPTPRFRDYFVAGLLHALRDVTDEQRDLLDPDLRRLVERHSDLSRERFLLAYEAQIALTREMRRFHQDYDALVTPSVAVPAFAAGQLSRAGYDPDDWLSWSPFTYPFNLTGQPALSLPCGAASGRPAGLQIVAGLYQDRRLLAIGRWAERIFEEANL